MLYTPPDAYVEATSKRADDDASDRVLLLRDATDDGNARRSDDRLVNYHFMVLALAIGLVLFSVFTQHLSAMHVGVGLFAAFCLSLPVFILWLCMFHIANARWWIFSTWHCIVFETLSLCALFGVLVNHIVVIPSPAILERCSDSHYALTSIMGNSSFGQPLLNHGAPYLARHSNWGLYCIGDLFCFTESADTSSLVISQGCCMQQIFPEIPLTSLSLWWIKELRFMNSTGHDYCPFGNGIFQLSCVDNARLALRNEECGLDVHPSPVTGNCTREAGTHFKHSLVAKDKKQGTGSKRQEKGGRSIEADQICRVIGEQFGLVPQDLSMLDWNFHSHETCRFPPELHSKEQLHDEIALRLCAGLGCSGEMHVSNATLRYSLDHGRKANFCAGDGTYTLSCERDELSVLNAEDDCDWHANYISTSAACHGSSQIHSAEICKLAAQILLGPRARMVVVPHDKTRLAAPGCSVSVDRLRADPPLMVKFNGHIQMPSYRHVNSLPLCVGHACMGVFNISGHLVLYGLANGQISQDYCPGSGVFRLQCIHQQVIVHENSCKWNAFLFSTTGCNTDAAQLSQHACIALNFESEIKGAHDVLHAFWLTSLKRTVHRLDKPPFCYLEGGMYYYNTRGTPKWNAATKAVCKGCPKQHGLGICSSFNIQEGMELSPCVGDEDLHCHCSHGILTQLGQDSSCSTFAISIQSAVCGVGGSGRIHDEATCKRASHRFWPNSSIVKRQGQDDNYVDPPGCTLHEGKVLFTYDAYNLRSSTFLETLLSFRRSLPLYFDGESLCLPYSDKEAMTNLVTNRKNWFVFGLSIVTAMLIGLLSAYRKKCSTQEVEPDDLARGSRLLAALDHNPNSLVFIGLQLYRFSEVVAHFVFPLVVSYWSRPSVILPVWFGSGIAQVMLLQGGDIGWLLQPWRLASCSRYSVLCMHAAPIDRRTLFVWFLMYYARCGCMLCFYCPPNRHMQTVFEARKESANLLSIATNLGSLGHLFRNLFEITTYDMLSMTFRASLFVTLCYAFSSLILLAVYVPRKDKFQEVEALANKVRLGQVQLESSYTAFTVIKQILNLVVDIGLDMATVLNMLKNQDFYFTYVLFTCFLSSIAIEVSNGRHPVAMYREIVKTLQTGVPTNEYLAMIDSETGLETVVSLSVTVYSFPYLTSTPHQAVVTIASILWSLKTLGGYVVHQTDYGAETQ